MEESTIIIDDGAIARGQVESVLETTLREGARRLLQEALALEVEEYSRRTRYGEPIVALKSYILSPFVDEGDIEAVVAKLLEAREKIGGSG